VSADAPSPAVAEDVFNRCQKLVRTQQEFDTLEAHGKTADDAMRQLVKDTSETDRLEWHKSSNTKWYLETHLGHAVVGQPTITAVGPFPMLDGGNYYVFKSLYLPNIDDTGGAPARSALSNLSEYFYDSGKVNRKNTRNFYSTQKRGGKASEFSMYCSGTHSRIPGKGSKGQPTYPARYNPSGKPNNELDRLHAAHVNDMTDLEERFTPGCADTRRATADACDPDHQFRLTPEATALASSLTRAYVTQTHKDGGGFEFIMFEWTSKDRLPPGHGWFFAVDGCIYPLPAREGERTIISVAPGVYHSTLPTSSTEATVEHAGVGSALFTKNTTVAVLRKHQQRQGDGSGSTTSNMMVDTDMDTPTRGDGGSAGVCVCVCVCFFFGKRGGGG
jgi:hypothetical protein